MASFESEDGDAESNFMGATGINIQSRGGYLVALKPQEKREAVEAFSTNGEGFVSAEDWDRLDKIKQMAEVLDEILFWCWNVKVGEKYRLRKFKSAQNCFVAMTALVKPELLEGKTYEEIGSCIGIGKARMSAMARDFQVQFGLTFNRGIRDGAAHSAAAKKSWQNPGRIKTWAKK